MIWHTPMITKTMQNFVFIWYEKAYLNKNSIKCVFLWCDMAYPNTMVQNLYLYGMMWHIYYNGMIGHTLIQQSKICILMV